MNGINGAHGPPGIWQEARNADGRVYYYHTQTKVTQWTKPAEIMTPTERALANQPWKEWTHETTGRKYWYNAETKQSSWEMPEVYKNALAQAQPSLPAKPAAPASQFVAGGGAFQAYPQRDQENLGERIGPERQIGYGQSDTNGNKGPTFQKASGPEYNTYEEAEAAFFKLLKRSNVQSDWTWEQTMRATIKDPQYQAIKDPKDRKAAFEKYVVDLRLQEKDRAKERLAKLRADFGTMLKSHREIKNYTRWKTARPIIEHEAIFRSTDNENERRQLFEEYIIDLKKANVEREAITRKSAMDELVSILKALDLEPYTRWSEAQSIIQTNERFTSDDKFKSLTKSDVLTAFENHIKSLERTFNDERQKEKASKARRERKSRDGFIDLLRELRLAGKVKAGTKWIQINPEIKSEPRYDAILGQSGSTPLDLFRDVVEEEERALRLIRNDVYDVLEDKRYEITPKTTFDEFHALMQSDRRTSGVSSDSLNLIFSRLLEKVQRRSEEDKHASERQTRRAVDALRSRIKHLDSPPVHVSSTWESVRSQISSFDEFKVLDSEELRRSAFEKVIRRLKEKEEDIERDRETRASSKRADRERDRDRGAERASARGGDWDRERDRASFSDSRRGAGSARRPASRSPEVDAYEADRRKAMADRERQYRKGPTGLSPPPSATRDRHERISSRHAEGRLVDSSRYEERGYERSERDRDRDEGRRRGDRERGERDDDPRERLYRSRRGETRDELDYDGGGVAGGARGSVSGGPGSAGRRRRGESEGAESVGSARKRVRRGGGDERSPRDHRDRDRDNRDRDGNRESNREREVRDKEARREKDKEAEAAKKEEVAVHSGSEEGEMVEE